MTAHRLDENWIHLGLGASADPQPPFTGMDWYEAYGKRADGDGAEARLVSQHCFTKSWDVWEMHPEGAEVVICLEGSLTLIQEVDGEHVPTTLGPGEYAINPPGIWHTADTHEETNAIFITAGKGTQHRPR